MSLRAMELVWSSDLEHTRKFVALCLANYADENGGNIFPAMQTVADRTSISKRTAQRIIKCLKDEGVLAVDGITNKGIPRYRLVFAALTAFDRGVTICHPPLSENAKNVVNVTPGVTQLCHGGVTSTTRGGDTAVSPDPLINHQLTSILTIKGPNEKISENWTVEMLWSAVVGQLSMDMSKGQFETWVKKSKVVGVQETTMVVSTPNTYARDWLTNRMAVTIGRILSGCTMGAVNSAKFITEGMAA